MLRARKLSLAGIAVGALALTVSTSVPMAYGHGYTTGPTSRAKHCQNGTVQNCGQIQWEPQSVEGPKGFPAEQSYNFRWYLTAPHSTTDFKYYITKQGWNQNAPLTRSALDLNPFLTVPLNGGRPANNVSHPGTVPSGRTGRHMILAVWTISDTANAFYQCSDVRF
jgi:chitin-binding protein